MGTINYSTYVVGHEFLIIKWASLAGGDDGQPYKIAKYADVSIHVKGIFNGRTLTIQGDNDVVGTPTWATLNNPQGDALTFATEAIKQLLENVGMIRPIVNAGEGASLDVYMKITY